MATADDLGLVGLSAVMCDLRAQIRRFAGSNAPILIVGETGAGKELVARAIHAFSKRAAGPLVCVNCGALNGELLESELFGHEKGAFTGAIASRAGKFEHASAGTLFLDEINSTNPEFQVKLLRVLEEKSVTPVGGNRTIAVDVRVVAATNQILLDEITAGRFRKDLFYRLNVLSIYVPALRERGDDVIELSNHFTRKYSSEEGKAFIEVSERSQAALRRHAWPGNVRELQNVVHRAVVCAEVGGPTSSLDVDVEASPLESAASADGAKIADLVFDSLLNKRQPLEGLLQGDTGFGPTAAFVVQGIAAGVDRYLRSAAGQELVSRSIKKGFVLELIGLSSRRPGSESQFAGHLRQEINAIYERHCQ